MSSVDSVREVKENTLSQTSKDKLNAVHLGGAVGVAAIIAAVAGSWVLFVLVAVALIGASLATGEIRLQKRSGKRRRH